MGLRPELHAHDTDKGKHLPAAAITLSKKEKKEFYEFLHSVKVPSGYSSNIARLLSVKELERRHFETLCILEVYFPPSFFDIMVHLTAHLVKEIHYFIPVFLHHMFPYERYMGVLKSYVRNQAFPEDASCRVTRRRMH